MDHTEHHIMQTAQGKYLRNFRILEQCSQRSSGNRIASGLKTH
jgi:hypothetical protein